MEDTDLLTANDIYTAPVLEESHNINNLIGIHLGGFVSRFNLREQERILLRTHYYHTYDHRRYLNVQSVWFDGTPCMIVMDAGREGRDENRTIVTDKKTVINMMLYIKTLEELEVPELIEMDIDTPSPLLTVFHNVELNHLIEP